MDIYTLRRHIATRDAISILETIDVTTGIRSVLKEFDQVIEAPNWTRDGRLLVYNSGGRIYTYELATGNVTPVETGFARSGLMQIWRMESDDANPVHLIQEEANCWFPHVSPDGGWVAYIAYGKDNVAPGDHPANKHVELRLAPAAGGATRTIVELFGGQGTLT